MGEFRKEMSHNFAAVPRIRRALTNFAQTCGFSGQELADVESAIGEALANAAEHGGSGGAAMIDVVAFVDGAMLVVDVIDHGRGFLRWEDSTSERPISDSPRGYGIFMMRQLMDKVTYSDNGATLRLLKRLPCAETWNGCSEKRA